ncbi:MAG: 23S rRNA (guanosine(2251)-2'-O)-methyltransferase RlmB [Bacteroidetes bacterium]|nr:23S rRNA (guanosine(2251)-2'-O)-methyltransferase RlmB [Bacteroidota bacterium]
MNHSTKDQVIYGVHPIAEALDSNTGIEKVFIRQGLNTGAVRSIINDCRDKNIPCVYTPNQRLNQMTKGNHQGVVAYLSHVHYVTLDDIIHAAQQKGEHPLIIVCDGITDVRNVGAIARSAYCMGAHGMVMPVKSGAMINEEAVKTSAGTILKLPLCREKSVMKCIEQLKLNGIRVLGADMNTRSEIHREELNIPLALLLGDEGSGVSDVILKACDQIVKIPMSSGAESLNVSVAAGIMIYEVMKQRI